MKKKELEYQHFAFLSELLDLDFEHQLTLTLHKGECGAEPELWLGLDHG